MAAAETWPPFKNHLLKNGEDMHISRENSSIFFSYDPREQNLTADEVAAYIAVVAKAMEEVAPAQKKSANPFGENAFYPIISFTLWLDAQSKGAKAAIEALDEFLQVLDFHLTPLGFAARCKIVDENYCLALLMENYTSLTIVKAVSE